VAGLSIQAYCFQVRQEPTRGEHLKSSPNLGGLLALPANIILGWKGLPGTNTLTFNEYS
jgi:hypothetical protein